MKSTMKCFGVLGIVLLSTNASANQPLISKMAGQYQLKNCEMDRDGLMDGVRNSSPKRVLKVANGRITFKAGETGIVLFDLAVPKDAFLKTTLRGRYMKANFLTRVLESTDAKYKTSEEVTYLYRNTLVLIPGHAGIPLLGYCFDKATKKEFEFSLSDDEKSLSISRSFEIKRSKKGEWEGPYLSKCTYSKN